MCAFDEYSCVCARAHADAFIKNSALSAHCFRHVCSLINIPAAGRSGAGSEAHSHKRTRRRKGRKCSGFGFELGFCSQLYTLPFSGTTARNGGLFSGGSGALKTPLGPGRSPAPLCVWGCQRGRRDPPLNSNITVCSASDWRDVTWLEDSHYSQKIYILNKDCFDICSKVV